MPKLASEPMRTKPGSGGRPCPELLAALGARIARIENRAPALEGDDGPDLGAALSLGIGEIDAMLNGAAAIPAAALHEVRAPGAADAAAAAGFALALALRSVIAGKDEAGARPVLFWIAGPDARREAGLPYGPGLQALGLGGMEIIRVFPANLADALWAAGEVAAHEGAGACLLELRGNPPRAGLAFSRRLALRAREAGVPVILLRQGGAEEASAAMTRWRVSPAPSDPGAGAGRKWLGPPAFGVTLEKCRGGRPGQWLMEWKSDERLFALARSGGRIQPAGLSPGGTAGPPLPLARPHRTADGPAEKTAPRPGMARAS